MVRKISLKQWTEEGTKLFGEDKKKWKFVCPSCKHVQTIQDFIDIKNKGVDVDPQTAFFSCIGRFLDESDGTMFNKKSPCNYTLGGLFVLAETKVIDEEGAEHSVFEFAN